MRIEFLTATMTKNHECVSGTRYIDTTPRFVGSLIDEAGAKRGVLVWWNRYRMSNDGERVGVSTPLIGGQFDGERFETDVATGPDRKTMSARVRTADGYEIIISLDPKTVTEKKQIVDWKTLKVVKVEETKRKIVEAVVRVGGVWIEQFDAAEPLPEDYFFPDSD